MRAEFLHQTFEQTFRMLEQGDVVYSDPPYIPLSATSNFTTYSKESFGPAQQERLVELSAIAATSGSPALISNHDTSISRQLYKKSDIIDFDVQRLISSKASTRGMAPELLAIYAA